MIKKFLDYFKLFDEKEDFATVSDSIYKSVVFRGTNLWILIFAIFVASLGLNMNSTAVIIGAMLISPLMGPIMGIGFGMAINDLKLLRNAFSNYFFAASVGLTASTIYFLLSPINDAHSEILSRTAPTIYDVLIAFFGGLAGIVAVCSNRKGNVIPGVAIATALMPPLCTAGYGLATLQLYYFFGAFYLFIINTVFIALAALVASRLMKFPYKRLPDAKANTRSQRIIGAIVIITLAPSIYFGYDVVRTDKFNKNAERFVELEAVFPNDYLLNKEIDAKRKSITLTFGGKKITPDEISLLKKRLPNYNLENAALEVKQGFAYLTETKGDDKLKQLSVAFSESQAQVQFLKERLDSIGNEGQIGVRLFNEIKILYPLLSVVSVNPSLISIDDKGIETKNFIVILQFSKRVSVADKRKIEEWLKARLQLNTLKIIIEY